MLTFKYEPLEHEYSLLNDGRETSISIQVSITYYVNRRVHENESLKASWTISEHQKLEEAKRAALVYFKEHM